VNGKELAVAAEKEAVIVTERLDDAFGWKFGSGKVRAHTGNKILGDILLPETRDAGKQRKDCFQRKDPGNPCV
jgi:hypothetical protein